MPEPFTDLSTPLVADACVRLGVPPRAAPAGVRPVVAGQRLAGRVLPVRHHGSVDVFLEAYTRAAAGDVLVIDNGGRRDADPGYTFRAHLRHVGGAIEE